MPILFAVSALVISFSLILTTNDFIHFFSYIYSLATFGYFVYYACGNSLGEGFTNLIISDFFKALIIMPFCSFGCMFKAMFAGGSKRKNKVFLKILIGIGIAFIPTLIVLSLLSYDSNFTDLLNKIFAFDFDEIWSHIGSLILGIPLGLYGYGLFISSVDNKCKNVITKDGAEKTLAKIRIAPLVTIIAGVTPLLFLYVVFFISQWDYYISGFTGVLPKDFSYATYAREGFFQLCIVSVINLLIITAVILFLKRKTNISSAFLKCIVLIFSLATLVLISTAVAKMVMYINTYGLTPKRVYATWFMMLIAVLFILISLRMFIRKIKIVAVALALCVAMFALIALPDVDGFIAEYNVDRYISGSLETVDLDAMKDLGSSAIPAMIELKEHLDTKIDSVVDNEDYNYYEIVLCAQLADYFIEASGELRHSDRNVFSYTIPDKIAQQKLKEIGYF